MTTYTALALILFQYQSTVAQQKEARWELISKENGFELFSRSNPLSDMDEIRITFYVNSSLDRIAAVINDVDHYENWVYRCQEAYKKEVFNANEYNFYLRTDFPFPLSDRHMLVHCQQQMDKDKGEYHSFSNLINTDLEQSGSCEHMCYFKSSWKVKAIASTYYRIDYQVLADPSQLPAWAVNLAITKGPLESMQRFKALVEESDNQKLTTELHSR